LAFFASFARRRSSFALFSSLISCLLQQLDASIKMFPGWVFAFLECVCRWFGSLVCQAVDVSNSRIDAIVQVTLAQA
jgi:hypothetical protein